LLLRVGLLAACHYKEKSRRRKEKKRAVGKPVVWQILPKVEVKRRRLGSRGLGIVCSAKQEEHR